MYEKIEKLTNNSRFSMFMLLSISAYTVLKFPFRSIADIFQTIFLLGFLLCLYVDRKTLKTNKVFLILLIALVFPILSWINSKVYIPEIAKTKPSLSDSVNLFYFLPIAYFINKDRNKIWFVWVAFTLGLLLSAFHYSPNLLTQLQEAINGQRIDFGFYNLQHASAWAGACVIALSGLCLKLLSERKKTPLLVVSILFLIATLFIFLATQTRQTFLGIFVSILITSIYYIKKTNISRGKVALLLLSFIFISFVLFSNSGIKDRTIRESKVYSEILSGDYNDYKNADSSSSIRIALWNTGYQWIKEHPFLGGGEGVSQHVINTSPYTPDESKKRGHNHLHSYYVELAVSYGLVGLVVILSLFICIYLNVLNREEDNQFDEIQFVGLVFIPYWMIVNVFEPHLLTPPGQLIHNVMIGTFFFFSMKNNSQETRV